MNSIPKCTVIDKIIQEEIHISNSTVKQVLEHEFYCVLYAIQTCKTAYDWCISGKQSDMAWIILQEKRKTFQWAQDSNETVKVWIYNKKHLVFYRLTNVSLDGLFT